MSASTTKGAARDGGGATSGELGIVLVLRAREGHSTIHTRPESTPSQHRERGDARSRHHDNRRRVQRHDNNDDHDRSWSPSQRGLRAFGQSIRNAKFPLRFHALINIPR
jgi:hypothetical protein